MHPARDTLLALLLSPHPLTAIAHALELPVPDLLDRLEDPVLAADLDRLARHERRRFTLAATAAAATAIDTLRQLAADTNAEPTERRRAATTILRPARSGACASDPPPREPRAPRTAPAPPASPTPTPQTPDPQAHTPPARSTAPASARAPHQPRPDASRVADRPDQPSDDAATRAEPPTQSPPAASEPAVIATPSPAHTALAPSGPARLRAAAGAPRAPPAPMSR